MSHDQRALFIGQLTHGYGRLAAVLILPPPRMEVRHELALGWITTGRAVPLLEEVSTSAVRCAFNLHRAIRRDSFFGVGQRLFRLPLPSRNFGAGQMLNSETLSGFFHFGRCTTYSGVNLIENQFAAVGVCDVK